MTYTIDRPDRLVRILGSGRLTDDEMIQCVTALRDDPDLEAGMDTLSDMRNIEVGFTRDGVLRMVEVMRASDARRSNARAAIVVSSDLAFGMGRMFESWAQDQVDPAIRIFRSLEDAKAWFAED